ncbi:MAG: TetR/AcrR family transcriptional regulator [Acidimicrobiales bacterium]
MSQRQVKEPKAPLRLDPVTRRALLVQAAAAVFRGRDPGDVSFEEVAEAGGVSRSLVYAYFGDRGGLIAAVYLHNLEQLDRELGRFLDDQLPDEVRLRRIVRRYLVFARDHEAAWNVMTAAGALHHPAIQAARRERIERIAAAWGSGPTPRLVARGVVGLLEAGAQDWVDYRDAGLERATDVLFAVLWEGITGLRERGIVAAS